MLSLLPFIITKFAHEIGFRIVGIFIYPLAYILRWKIRDVLYSGHKAYFEQICFTDDKTLPIPKFTLKERLAWLLWLFLDDSPAKDSIVRVRASTYNLSKTYDSALIETAYPFKFIYKYKILRDYWWSSVRNSHVNYFSWIVTGGWTDDKKVISGDYEDLIGNGWAKVGEKWFKQYRNGKYLISVKHKNGKYYPFYQYHSDKWLIAIGKNSGSGRETFTIRKSKPVDSY